MTSSPWRALAVTASLATLLGPSTAAAGEASQGRPPAPVRVAQVEMREMAPTVAVPGTVVSREDARVSAEVTGRLVWVAEIGDTIPEGEPVARIDDTSLKLQEAEAENIIRREEARLVYLRRETERLTELAAQNNAARSQLESTRSQRDMAASELEIARVRLRQIQDQLNKTTMAAPFTAMVTERLANNGERVAPGDQVVRLVDPTQLEAVTRAPLASFSLAGPGTRLEVVGDSGRRAMGTVRTLVPFGDSRSHMFEVRLDVDADTWRPGETVRIFVPTAEARRTLAVPRDALVLRREGSRVVLVGEDGSTRMVPVEIGVGVGSWVEVAGELEAGDTVIVRGAERLMPGQTVRILEDGSAGP